MLKLAADEQKTFRLRLAAIRGLNPMPPAQRAHHDIRDLQVGDYLTFEKANWLVQEKHRYRETKWDFSKLKRYECWELRLFSLSTGQTHFMEWGEDDEIEISFSTQAIKWRELQDTAGRPLKKSDLDDIADEEGAIVYAGQRYYYEDDESWAANFYRDNGQQSERVRFYEFESERGDYLTVEAWYEDDERECEVWLSREVAPREISVLQLASAAV